MEERAADIERAAHADILAALEVNAPRVEFGGKMAAESARDARHRNRRQDLQN